MAKSALLLLTSPFSKLKHRVHDILSAAQSLVDCTLYVHLQPSSHKSTTANSAFPRFTLQPVPPTQDALHLVRNFYQTNASFFQHIDLRILQGHFTNGSLNFQSYQFSHSYDIVLHDLKLIEKDHIELEEDIAHCFHSNKLVKDFVNIFQIPPFIDTRESNDTGLHQFDDSDNGQNDALIEMHKHVALGGTFDRLHIGHKVLLSHACFLASQSVTIGISDGPLIAKKLLCELIEALSKRITDVRQFVQDIKPNVELDIVKLEDIFGPTITDPKLDCIVVSQETKRGADLINVEREKRNMSVLNVHVIELLDDTNHLDNEEEKISSSNQRKRLLGTLLRAPNLSPKLVPLQPYCIGLTGGIGSGKSSVCKRLQNLGAGVVDCDKLGHQVYLKGTPLFQEIVEQFGVGVVGNDGEINRTELGKIVFADKEMLKKLNQMVWPAIAKLAKSEIAKLAEEGKSIVVLEAAVLLEANWINMVHEIWVTVIPKSETVKRLMQRNKLSEVDAEVRIQSQMSNTEKVAAANVVLCTLWEYEETQKQVEKAWSLLLNRQNLHS